MPVFVISSRIMAPAEECFALSLSIDAHTGSMAQSSEQAVAGTVSGEISLGETVTWSARHFGLRFRMTSKIVEYHRPGLFVDEQVTGPFKHWWHEHEFLSDGETTLMIDRIDFAAPFGIIGWLVDRVLLTGYMKRLIGKRNAWLKHNLES